MSFKASLKVGCRFLQTTFRLLVRRLEQKFCKTIPTLYRRKAFRGRNIGGTEQNREALSVKATENGEQEQYHH